MIDERDVREMLLRRAHAVPATPVGTGTAVRRARRRLLVNGIVTTVAAAAIAVATVAGIDAIRTAQIPGHEPTPTPDVSAVRLGWPDTSRNPAGVYSWDGSRCASDFCIVGFMHNGYGSGDVEIRVEVSRGPITDDGATAVTVGGHDGIYRRIDARREEWIVDIEGTTIAIHLNARPGTSQTDLAEAHAIIDSIRTEPQDNLLGFRLVFTLTTNDWDSG